MRTAIYTIISLIIFGVIINKTFTSLVDDQYNVDQVPMYIIAMDSTDSFYVTSETYLPNDFQQLLVQLNEIYPTPVLNTSKIVGGHVTKGVATVYITQTYTPDQLVSGNNPINQSYQNIANTLIINNLGISRVEMCVVTKRKEANPLKPSDVGYEQLLDEYQVLESQTYGATLSKASFRVK